MSTHGQGKEFSGGNANAADLWSELIASEPHYHHQEPEIPIVYRRKNAHSSQNVAPSCQLSSSSGNENRVSWAPVKRFSWNRSLSTRGRTSIAVSACVNHKPQQGKPKRKARPPLPKGKVVQATYEKELTYFQEVDSFVLLEESPSPKNSSTWAMGIQSENVMSHLSSVLKKWLVTRKLNYSQGPSSTLSKILETPELNKEAMCDDVFDDSSLKTPEKGLLQMSSGLHSTQRNSPFGIKDVLESHMSSRKDIEGVRSLGEGNEDIEVAIHKLSLTSRLSSLESQRRDSLLALLTVCGQSSPTTLLDVFSKYCEPECIVKVGEGTYGEAFKAGQTVCKIVPFDGDLLVNGEVQKKSEELLEEVVLCLTLNRLRGHPEPVYNACTTFIQTLNLKVCQGPYDASLIYAWEQWDTKHGSENDHPKEFGEDQSYVVFVQEHGGQDLESFVLLNFDEARSLLVQVTVALAVAEAAFQFEHRDLHWGNILLSRKESALLEFTLEGRKINVRTFGLVISIIDFTLSRINTGEDILFLDLSSDPGLFEGPKGDKQFDTYRKMKEVTEECWEGSFPKTNVLWLQYLVDILLMKKSYDKNSKSDRDLRSLKKRLNNYGSAKEATSDPFFTDLFISDHVK